MNVGKGPRKVIVGTVMHNMFGTYPGLSARLGELSGLVEQAAAAAQRAYPGRGVDIVALPEYAVAGGLEGPAEEIAVPLAGAVTEKLGGSALAHSCYVVAPLILDEGSGVYSNAAVLFDRSGEVAGIYRKVHAVPGPGDNELEGGIIAGRGFPVFECDFGKLGIQICFDMAFDAGWETLGRKGAELVVWPSQWPGRISAAARALSHGYYVLSSTWRNNASLIDPTGHVIQDIHDDGVFVHEIDLDYAILSWQATLQEGRAFTDAYSTRAGYRYDPAEDCGIFWSNDPDTPIAEMVSSLGLETRPAELTRSGQLQDALRGGPPSPD